MCFGSMWYCKLSSGRARYTVNSSIPICVYLSLIMTTYKLAYCQLASTSHLENANQQKYLNSIGCECIRRIKGNMKDMKTVGINIRSPSTTHEASISLMHAVKLFPKPRRSRLRGLGLAPEAQSTDVNESCDLLLSSEIGERRWSTWQELWSGFGETSHGLPGMSPGAP